jgi:hypothetical protein
VEVVEEVVEEVVVVEEEEEEEEDEDSNSVISLSSACSCSFCCSFDIGISSSELASSARFMVASPFSCEEEEEPYLKLKEHFIISFLLSFVPLAWPGPLYYPTYRSCSSFGLRSSYESISLTPSKDPGTNFFDC